MYAGLDRTGEICGDEKIIISSDNNPVRPVSEISLLANLVRDARARFRAVALWNVPTLPDLREDATLVVRQLRTYAGRAGWTVAGQIEQALQESAVEDGPDAVADFDTQTHRF